MSPSSLLISIFFSLLLLITHHPPPASAQQQFSSFSTSNSPWLPSQNRTLVSPNATFAAGFRSSTTTSSSSLYFFAVWVHTATDKTIVWSLNSDRPVNRSSPLVISPLGVLSLNDSSGNNLWGNAIANSTDAKLVLNEDGSLVFGSWTSFASPTDTILPNQNFPANGTSLVSGNFQFVNATVLVFNGSADNYWSNNNAIQNLTSAGVLMMGNSISLITADVGKNLLRRLTLDRDGNLRIYSLDPSSGKWKVVWQAVQELCTIRGTCGLNSICVTNESDTTATTCVCPPGFRFAGDGSGCKRKTGYLPNSKFLRLDYVNFAVGPDKTELTPLVFDSCKSRCLANTTCIGFSYKFNGQQYCVHHVNRFVYGYWSPATEVSMFLRVAESESDVSNFTGMTTMIDTVCPVHISLPFPPKESKTTARNIAIISTLFVLELLAGVLSFWAFLRKYSKYRDMARTFGLEFLPAGGPKRFSYAELKAATNDFSNVVGRGGFGVVYKGELPDHRIVAVKRLKNVAGGEAEFWAEVTIIARMHHLNLVRMWGFCAEKEQRMLVYEYIPNGSLDKFLFQPSIRNEAMVGDQKKIVPPRPLLDWNIRYRIAVGVARAIAYLHEECLEWVLHCDIKPENILLEDDFCPKVSDFGLAKLAKKEDMVALSRIRGTRGYMAPEWVIQRDPITAKADVYSFGMVLLEIVSGVRNFEFQRSSLESEDWYFPKWAFEKVYVEKKVEDILDGRILESYDSQAHFAMVDRMVKTAMWCLQDRAEMRPSMGKVAKMLEGTVEITEPAKPTIFYLKDD